MIRSAIAVAALAACSLATAATETVLKNKEGLVLGTYSCNEQWGTCSVQGDYLQFDINSIGTLTVVKATWNMDSIFAYVKIAGDCVAVHTDFMDDTFYINRVTKAASSNHRAVCVTDGYSH